jgi:hypothetical protein
MGEPTSKVLGTDVLYETLRTCLSGGGRSLLGPSPSYRAVPLPAAVLLDVGVELSPLGSARHEER